MATIAKFMCTERHERTHTSPYTTPDAVPEPGPSEVQVKLEAAQRVSEGPDGDNVDWSKYTPVGELTMTITNPAAFGQFVVGQDYFLEIRKAQPQKARGGDDGGTG